MGPVSTDSSGVFRLDGIPRRTAQLRLRVIGYVPHVVGISPDGPLVDLGEVEMPRPVQELNRVLIEETFMTAERRGFEDRKKSGVGIFLDDAYFKRWAIPSANTIKLASTRIRGSSGPRGDILTLRYLSGIAGNGSCYPLVFWMAPTSGGRVRHRTRTFLVGCTRTRCETSSKWPSGWRSTRRVWPRRSTQISPAAAPS